MPLDLRKEKIIEEVREETIDLLRINRDLPPPVAAKVAAQAVIARHKAGQAPKKKGGLLPLVATAAGLFFMAQ